MEMPNQSRVKLFLKSILTWGAKNKRDFPWRKDPDPFHILVAEFLLQRSRAKTVSKVYSQLFNRWPSYRQLAAVSISDISDVIGPLGLNKRAASLKDLAIAIKQRAGVPDNDAELRQLPGVGWYIASATLLTAFNKNILLIDSVTSRVYRRYFGLSGCMSTHNYSSSAKEATWDFLSGVMSEQTRELNWSVLDLAASICLPKVPKCNDCPLESGCSYAKTKNRMKVVELFAGVGGFRLGLESSGWQTVWGNQWEPTTKVQHASQCYSSNFRNRHLVTDDIKKVLDEVESGEREIPDHELLVGGFPCQDYSVARTANHAVGITGKKGVLWWEIYRLLQLKKPPLLLLENVDRLLKSPANQRGRDFAIMLACLSDLGYLVEWRVVNAADYGFPQKRRRVFIAGMLIDELPAHSPIDILHRDGVLAKALPVRLDEVQPALQTSFGIVPDLHIDGDIPYISESFGTGLTKSPFVNSGVVFKRDVWTRKLSPAYRGRRKTLSDVLQEETEVDEGYFVPESELERWKYLKGAKREERMHTQSGTRYVYAEGGIPFPDDLDQPGRTILTGEGGNTPSRFKHIIRTSDGRYRRLTPIELERMNGFPDGWTDIGIPDSRRTFLMGNALVVGVVERIGKSMADVWCKKLAGGL